MLPNILFVTVEEARF